MAKARVTVAEAERALFDYRVPPAEALDLYRQARRRRFGDVGTAFMLHVAGVCREAAEEQAARDVWCWEGGTCA